jgi:hypothetical protein
MSIHQFITVNSVQPADAIVLNKKFFGMVDHYVIYLGIVGAVHQFVANYVNGVRLIENDEIQKYLTTLVPTKIDRFPGIDRPAALKRARSRIGERAYNYLANNCEHFKNFVHKGISESTQVQKVGGLLALGGAGVTLMGMGKKNDGMAVVGFFIILIGIIVALLGRPDQDHSRK